MPIIQSAKKALRGSARKRVTNDRRKKAVSIAVKTYKKLIIENKLKEAKAFMPTLQKAIDKGSKRGIFKANTGSRKLSRLSKVLKKTAAK